MTAGIVHWFTVKAALGSLAPCIVALWLMCSSTHDPRPPPTDSGTPVGPERGQDQAQTKTGCGSGELSSAPLATLSATPVRRRPDALEGASMDTIVCHVHDGPPEFRHGSGRGWFVRQRQSSSRHWRAPLAGSPFVSNSKPMSAEVEKCGQPGPCPTEPSAVSRLAFSLRETAQMLGVCEKSVRRLIDRGLLKTSRALRHHRVTKQEIERFLNDTT